MIGVRQSRTGRPRTFAILVASCLVPCGCDIAPQQARTWRADCPPVEQPAPLSLEAARAAHRLAERRRELRFREAAEPGFFLREMHAALDPERIAAGEICLSDLAERGQLLFEHEYSFDDGLGSGSREPGGGPFRRVHRGAFGGPEAISCPSCHWIGGPNGGGSEVDVVFLSGDGERPASSDERNPPALMGLGVVQALSREMSAELRAQREALLRERPKKGGIERRLTAKGIDFGVLRLSEQGQIDASGVRGVDADLVIKPFGWKGDMATISEFVADALQVHMGIQSEELLAAASPGQLGGGAAEDPDGDGACGELGRGPFTALVVHLALLEMPIIAPLIMEHPLPPAAKGLRPPKTTSFAGDFARGRRHFHALGCAGCHVPMLVLKSPVLEIDGLPPIDLSREMRVPRLTHDAAAGGYPVWLFSDLRRHDMGESNSARHVRRGVARREYLTPRLWGLADSAPYLHDGRAPTLDYAIAGHDGEGAAARDAYAALSHEDQGALRVFLMSLRRTPRFVVP